MFASLPRDLDPLARAYRIHSKAARTGFTWENDEDVERQVEAEWLEFLDAETRKSDAEVKHELGDLLFTIAELGRRHGQRGPRLCQRTFSLPLQKDGSAGRRAEERTHRHEPR